MSDWRYMDVPGHFTVAATATVEEPRRWWQRRARRRFLFDGSMTCWCSCGWERTVGQDEVDDLILAHKIAASGGTPEPFYAAPR